MTMRAAPERVPVRAASTRRLSRLGNISGSRCSSAMGVAVELPREIMGRNPAARMISIGTDGHEKTTAGRLGSPGRSRQVNESSKEAVSLAMAEVVMMSDDSVGAQLFDAGLPITQPLTIHERIVLTDR